MSDEQMKKAEAIFEELADLPPADRETVLTERCGGDERLRDFVKQLLAEHDRGLGEFMQAPPAGVTAEPDLGPDARVGAYRLLERIGEGGFGEVHLAEQTEPIRRTVALKIVKLGMDTQQVVARFEAERQALALMDHPNIARVFEAGATEQGRPYFAMEHVPGVPITDYCDKHRLDMEQRLELFIHTCDAIQHAHQKGIIHRDLKPSNILIERFGDEHVPKVIDFGIAKAMGFSLTGRTPVTEQGQLIGTPEYMSPEQAVMSALNVDTRTDIYSLGVVLYELLTGALPFDPQTFRGKSFAEIQHTIREVEPPKPSTRLSTLDGEATEGSAAAIAARRLTDTRTLQRRLRGDLDWITMKAMDKERERRYASVSELAADLRHHLRHEPVLAGPPTAAYKLRKLMRRHRLGVTAATTIVLVLIAATAVTTWQAIRATDAEQLAQVRWTQAEDARAIAEREAAIARAVNDFLNKDLLTAASPKGQPRDITMREVLDAASESIEGRFGDAPLVEGYVRMTLGETYFELGLYDLAEVHLVRSLDLQLAESGEEDPDTIHAMSQLALVYQSRFRFDDAEPLARRALEASRRALGDHVETVRCLSLLGMILGTRRQLQEAEPFFVDALEMARLALGENDDTTLSCINNLAHLYIFQQRYDDAEPLMNEVYDRTMQVYGEEHPSTLFAMSNLAMLYSSAGRDEEAEPLFVRALELRTRVLGEEHPDTLTTMNNLATLYVNHDRFEEAEPLRVRTYEGRRRALGAEHPSTLTCMSNLAWLLAAQDRYDEAAALYEEALVICRRALGQEDRLTLIVMGSLGNAYKNLGRFEEGEALLLEEFDLARNARGEAHPDTQAVIKDLVFLYDDWGKPEQAAEYRALLEAAQGVIAKD
ncbi:MAG: tetratricopeptide repeat protein [Planctomycetota bacterium]|jgi:serine/threonine protein kinase